MSTSSGIARWNASQIIKLDWVPIHRGNKSREVLAFHHPYHGKLVLNGSYSFCSVKFIPHCPPVEFQASLQSFYLPQLLGKSRGVSGSTGKERPQGHNPNSSHCSLVSYSDQVLSHTIHQTFRASPELSRSYWVHWLPGANQVNKSSLPTARGPPEKPRDNREWSNYDRGASLNFWSLAAAV